VYRSPSESIKIFESKFADMMSTIKMKLPSSSKIIIIGDFNVDIMNNEGEKFLSQFEHKGFSLQVPENSSSTNNYTQLDLCFANFINCDCRYYENYFGYHKSITGVLNKPREMIDIQ